MRRAFLTLDDMGSYLVQYAGVSYGVAPNAVLLGMILFALQPDGVEFSAGTSADGDTLSWALLAATEAAYLMHCHANRRQRDRPALPVGVTLATVRGWVEDAFALCPAENRNALKKMMALRLGPNPWCETLN